MKDKSLRQQYEELTEQPTPAALFIEEVARVANRSTSAVRKWLTGAVQPDVNTMIALSKHFGVPYDVLFPINEKRSNGKR